MSEVRKGSPAPEAPGSRTGYVLDASARLCLISGEPGSERVAAVLAAAVGSAVDLAEVASKLGEHGAEAETARDLPAPLHPDVAPFGEETELA